MRVIILSSLLYVSQTHFSSECYSGTIKIGEKTYTKEHILQWIWPQVIASVVTVANSDKKFASFLSTCGNCQTQCLEEVMKSSTSALYGKLGQDFLSREAHVQDIIVEAVTGAFRACYPFPPREEAVNVAAAIVANIGALAPPAQQTFPSGVDCKNQGHEDDFPLHRFLRAFEAKFMQVMATNSEIHDLFKSESKDCQKSCLEDTVPMSVMTLFLTDRHNDDVGADALTGAIHACFPGVPEEDIKILVTETSVAMLNAETEAFTRMQYMEMHNNPQSLKSNAFPWFSLVVAMSLALCVGIAMGRRMNASPLDKRHEYELSRIGWNVFGSRYFDHPGSRLEL